MKFVSIILLSVVLYADCYRKATHDDQLHQLIKRADTPNNDTAENVENGEVHESVLRVADTENRDDDSEHREKGTGDGEIDQSLHTEEHGEDSKSMPKFVSKLIFHTPTSLTIELQPSGSFGSAIQACEIVVIKLDKDVNGFPRLTKQNTDLFLSFSPYHGRIQPQDPYIAARFGSAIFPRRITIGDDKHYGGLMNGELEPSSYYAIFLRGVARTGAETVHIVSDYLADFQNPSIPAYFPTDGPNNDDLFLPVMLSLGGLMMMAIFITAYFVMRKGNGPAYTPLSNTSEADPKRQPKSEQKRKLRGKFLALKKGAEDPADYQKKTKEIALKAAKQINTLGEQKNGKITEGMEIGEIGELDRLRARMNAYRKGVGQKIRGEQDETHTFKFILEGDDGLGEAMEIKNKEDNTKEKVG